MRNFAVLCLCVLGVGSSSSLAAPGKPRLADSGSRAVCVAANILELGGDDPTDPLGSPSGIVAIEISRNLDAGERRQLYNRLVAQGIRIFNRDAKSYTLVAEIRPDEIGRVSRQPGVVSVSRENENRREVWSHGNRTRRALRDESGDLLPSQPELWKTMPEPISGRPARSLEAIRKMAEESGYHIILGDRKPQDPEAIRALNTLYGGPIFFAGDLPREGEIVQLPGVAIHIGADPRSIRVRGDLSIALGHGDLHGAMDKLSEAQWVASVDPRAMAKGTTGERVIAAADSASFAAARLDAIARVERYLARAGEGAPSADDVRAVKRMVMTFFASARKRFPEGAFIKGRQDAATRESGQLVTTFSSPPGDVAASFWNDLRRFKAAAAVAGAAPGERTVRDDALGRALQDSEHPFSTLALALLKDPADLLVQQKLPVRKTPSGNVMEFRVDVIDGHVVNSGFRFGLDFYPEESDLAAQFVQTFIDKAPERYRYMSGGYDVVQLKDRSFRIIETNPGTDSSMLYAGFYPIEANRAISNLLGHPTALMQELERAFAGGLDAQAAYLYSLPREGDFKTSIAQLTSSEVVYWFMENYLRAWAKNPTRAGQARILEIFDELAHRARKESDDYYAQTRVGIVNYFAQWNLNNPPPPPARSSRVTGASSRRKPTK